MLTTFLQLAEVLHLGVEVRSRYREAYVRLCRGRSRFGWMHFGQPPDTGSGDLGVVDRDRADRGSIRMLRCQPVLFHGAAVWFGGTAAPLAAERFCERGAD